jgi:hypothetical protein
MIIGVVPPEPEMLVTRIESLMLVDPLAALVANPTRWAKSDDVFWKIYLTALY